MPEPTVPDPIEPRPEILDLLVVGAGPTGIALGAEARRRGLSVLLVDQGPLCAAIQAYPVDLRFFTTRDLLEIADVPFTIAEDKPSRRQTLVYYRSVVERYQVPLALHERVLAVHPPRGEGEDVFVVDSEHRGERRQHRARAVAVATGYFFNPDRLGVPGEGLPWVGWRYLDPYRHFGEHVVIVGAGNTAAEAALDLWRNGVRVTLVHRGTEVRRSIKYWLKPDIENRIAAGSIAARFGTVVTAFGEEGDERWVEVRPAGEELDPGGAERIPCDAAYVFIGYEPDVTLQVAAGVEVDPETLIPAHDPETCESNVPGLYLAGTLLAGEATDKIFIENSREHAPKIIGHLVARLGR
ncbi:MAG TPA: NAD(P)-binding domain-containing protein [Thermoanaerobaculia bacterium]|nr:NAD(P)-binding domain-containing protein [Thermoanaerobaculia bacterium]